MKTPLFAIVCVLFMIGAIVLLVGSVTFSTIYALGETDLEIEFVVTDADTGKPIPAAVVDVWWDDFREPKREERLTTDDFGVAAYRQDDCWCEDIITAFRPKRTIYFLRGGYAAEGKGYASLPKTWITSDCYRVIHDSSSKDGRFTRVQIQISLATVVP